MPGAIAGEDQGGSYYFSTSASPDRVKDYYDRELSRIGWQSFAVGTTSKNGYFLIYQNAGRNLSLSIIPQGSVTLVMILLY
jgi:hypothetical protein